MSTNPLEPGTPGDCILCHEPVTWEDLGFYGTSNPIHPECGTRSALGGIGHLTDHQRWCIEEGDPDMGLDYRESARRVVEWMKEQSWHGT